MENIHVAQFRDALNYFGINADKIDILCQDLSKMIKHHVGPGNYWRLLGTGAYKECYDIGEDIIVKFPSSNNETENEKDILEKAKEAGLSEIFLPSIFIPLEDDTLPIENLDYDPDYEGDFTWDSYKETYVERDGDLVPMELNYMIVQKRIDKTAGQIDGRDCDYYEANFTSSRYETDYLVDENGEKIDYEVIYWSAISNKGWLRTLIRKFGAEFLYKLKDFVYENDLSDLHEDNIGFLADDTPVILDWLS